VERAQSYAYIGKFHDVILLTKKPIHGRRFRNEVREQRSDGPHGRELLIGDFLWFWELASVCIFHEVMYIPPEDFARLL
jgi:hypothetical protein